MEEKVPMYVAQAVIDNLNPDIDLDKLAKEMGFSGIAVYEFDDD